MGRFQNDARFAPRAAYAPLPHAAHARGEVAQVLRREVVLRGRGVRPAAALVVLVRGVLELLNLEGSTRFSRAICIRSVFNGTLLE